MGVFRVIIRLRRDHALRSNIGFTHASIRLISIFRLLPAAKEVSLPEKNPYDLCLLVDGVIVTILSVGEPSLNDSIWTYT